MDKKKKDGKAERRESAARKKILEAYVKIVDKTNMFPTRMDLQKEGISRDMIRHYFVNISGLRTAAKEEFPDSFRGIISEKDCLEKSAKTQLLKDLQKYKRFVITTAINGQWAHSEFIKSSDHFCKIKNAKLLILPTIDPAHNLDNEIEWHFDESLIGHSFVFDTMKLNNNISVNPLKINAKQINPTTGLSRICQGNGSFIFASPKQSLEYIPVSNVKYPHALMTTGACTIPNYSTSRGNSLRTAFIAENDHVLGAIMVEIQDKEIYHFRQIQADEEGGFCDLGFYYNKNNKPLTILEKFGEGPKLKMGDYHAGEHDNTAINAWEQVIDQLKIDTVFFEDIFNGRSVNHHEENNIVLRAKHARRGLLSLEEELKVTGIEIDRILKHKSIKKGIIVRSNHDEFLERWLNNGKFKYDPINFQAGCRLADKSIDNIEPLQEGLKIYANIKNWNKLQFLKRDEDYKIGGVECGAHGDKGPNGAGGSKQSLERSYGKCVIAHSHTPGILRGVFQVGTSSLFDLGYNVGPSSWMHCSCIIYPNGHRQLINSIEGYWKL